MKVLVINCGSSSLKYQVLDMTNENLLCKGLVERIGMDGSVIGHEKIGQEKIKTEVPMKDHKDAIAQVLAAIQDPEHGVVKSMADLGAVGHRVVHAGEKYAKSVLITEEVIKALEECVQLAPLHNPPNLLGIAACQELMPNTPMVAVFDTAFHQTMPPESYIYALPYEYYTKYGIRRYGFHGTSHKYVAEKASQMLELERQFEAVMRQTEQESAGQVRMGIAQRRAIWFLPAVLSVYEREWPQVDVVIRDGNLADLTIMLKNRELDLVVLSQSDVTSEMETVPLGMEDFLLMVSGDHPLNEKAVPVEGSKLDFLDPHLLSGGILYL